MTVYVIKEANAGRFYFWYRDTNLEGYRHRDSEGAAEVVQAGGGIDNASLYSGGCSKRALESSSVVGAVVADRFKEQGGNEDATRNRYLVIAYLRSQAH